MPPTNCPRCRRMVFGLVRGLCADCVREEHESFERVKSYLRGRPDRPIADVSEACGVPVERLVRWLQEGRIEGVRGDEPGSGGRACKRCGRAIADGDRCAACRRAVADAIQAQLGDLRGLRQRQEAVAAAQAEAEPVAERLRRKREEEDTPLERFNLRRGAS